MNPLSFVEFLAELHFENTFNPYSDVCGDFDGPDAPAIGAAISGWCLRLRWRAASICSGSRGT